MYDIKKCLCIVINSLYIVISVEKVSNVCKCISELKGNKLLCTYTIRQVYNFFLIYTYF